MSSIKKKHGIAFKAKVAIEAIKKKISESNKIKWIIAFANYDKCVGNCYDSILNVIEYF